MWMVRAGEGGKLTGDFVQNGLVAFGGDRLPELSQSVTKDELLSLYAQHYPEEKERTRASWASQLLRFIHEIKVDDQVLLSDLEHRRYVLGKVTSEYAGKLSVGVGNLHGRHVQWTSEISRDALSPAAKNTLGSVLTVFQINTNVAKEIQSLASPLGQNEKLEPAPASRSEVEKNQEQLSLIAEETFQKSNEFIEDQIDALSPMQMQDLVAGLLRAMGYRTTVSEPGPDRGVDVFASPDGLGLQDPRIFVEVKHRANPMGAPEIRAFLGGRRKGDRCLYVSTGGFTKDAYYEADRAEVAVTLITLPRLRYLIVDFYDKLDSETRALVPLRRFYWPMVKTIG